MTDTQPPKDKPRNEEVDQCPQCEIMAWEAEQIYGRPPRYLTLGVLDCPNCRSLNFVKPGSAKGEAEALDGDSGDSLAKQVAEILREERMRGIRNGSGGARARKKAPGRFAGNIDEPLEWNANAAAGIVSIEVSKFEVSDARLTLELAETTVQRLVDISRWMDGGKDLGKSGSTPSSALRHSLRTAGKPYGVAQPLEELTGHRRHEFRVPGEMKADLQVAAHDNEVTLSETAEDMILKVWLALPDKYRSPSPDTFDQAANSVVKSKDGAP